MSTTPQIEERRQAVRVRLKAYGFQHQCDIRALNMALKAELIDVSSGGARLRFNDENGIDLSDQCEINLKLTLAGLLQSFIPCEIRWRRGQEFGVQFNEPLELSVGELQRLLER
jgi:c-di-GMP-binding flagellar brake protein YcgR